MGPGLLTENARFDQVLAPASRNAAATGATYLSMQDYEFITFVVDIGAITATGTVDAKVVQATSAAGAGSKDVTGAALVQIDDTGGSKQYAITVKADQLDHANGFYFVTVTLTPATAASLGGVTAIRWQAGTAPVGGGLTQDVRVVS